MAYEDYTIKEFMNAKFKQDYSVMSKQKLDEVYTEYIDTAELFETDEFERIVYIHFINNRINSVGLAIRIQKSFLQEFGTPYIEGLKYFKKFGHNIFWNNEEDFLRKLDSIELREKRYVSELEACIKELMEFRKKKNRGEKEVELTRGTFVKTLITLGKVGYKIENDKTTMEELSYMIKQQMDEVKEYKGKH